MTRYNIVSGKTNFLLVSVAAMFGLLFIIIAYYIFASRNPDKAKHLFRESADRHQSTVSSTSSRKDASTSSNSSASSNNLVGVKPDDVKPSQVPIGFQKTDKLLEPQVYNVSENIYSYDDAEAVCNVFGSELATYEQLVDAYKKGADWCNYGWTKGQMALYPTQYKSWLNMQENDPQNRDNCGLPGINGGYFDNKNVLFGVNCYGVKPSPRDHEKIRRKALSDKDIRNARKVAQLRSKMNDITVLPFNEDKWSSCNA